VAIAVLVCIVAVLLQLQFKPYKKAAVNWFQFITLIALLLTFFAGLLLRVNVDATDSYDRNAFGGILVLVNAFVIFIAGAILALELFVLGYQILKQIKEKLGNKNKH
jgi:predicted Na+-dependent transporter